MNKLDYAIVFVADMKRSVEFYRDVLGLPLRYESPGWTEFSNEGSTIALHPGDPTKSGGPAEGRVAAGTCQLGFVAEDLDAFHRTMESSGGECLQPPKLQNFGGRLAVYADPDGLALSVVESRKPS